jgi:hypothetical protein
MENKLTDKVSALAGLVGAYEPIVGYLTQLA